MNYIKSMDDLSICQFENGKVYELGVIKTEVAYVDSYGDVYKTGLMNEKIGRVEADGAFYSYGRQIGRCHLGEVTDGLLHIGSHNAMDGVYGRYTGDDVVTAAAACLYYADELFDNKASRANEVSRKVSVDSDKYSGGTGDFDSMMGVIGAIYQFVVFDFFEDMYREKRKMLNKDYIVYMLYLFMMLSFYYFDIYNLIRGFEGEGLKNLGEYIVAIGLSFLGSYSSICYVRKKSYNTNLFGYVWTVIKGCLINVMRFFVAFYCCGCVIHWFVIDILSDFITLPPAFQIDYWNF